MHLTIVANEAVRRDWEQQHLSQTGDLLFGPRCLTFANFLTRLADTDAPFADAGIRRMAIAEAMRGSALRHFGAVRHHPGTIDCFEETIVALKQGGIDPTSLRTLFATRGGAAEYDLLQTYERYNDLLQHWQVVDPGDLLTLACQRVGRAPRPPILHDCSAIEFLGTLADDVGAGRLTRALQTALPDLRVDCAAINSHGHARGNLSSEHREREGGTQQALPVGGATRAPVIEPWVELEVIAAPTPRQECRWVARYCATECFDHHVDPVQMVIVAPADRTLHAVLGQALADEGFPTDDLHGAGRIAERILHPARWHRLPPQQRLADWLVTWSQFCADFHNARQLADTLRGRRGDAAIVVALRDHARVVEATEQLRRLGALAPDLWCTADQWYTLVRRYLGPALPTPANGPLWCTFDDCPVTRRAQVIMMQCVEGIRPPKPSPLPFCMGRDFHDPDCEALRRILPTPEQALCNRQRQWHRWRALATNACIATYAQGGVDGRSTIPSAELPPASTHVYVDCLAMPVKRPLEEPTHIRTYAHTHNITLTDPAIRTHIAARFRCHCFSASQLERYASSPFAFYCQYVLGLRPEDAATLEIKPKDRGTLIHAVLEAYWRAPAPARDEIPEYVRGLTDRIVAAQRDIFAGAHPALIDRLRLATAQLCTHLLLREEIERTACSDPLTPHMMEWTFGEGTVAPLVIEMAGDIPIHLRGRVDRIDVNTDRSRFAVLDYKTGSPKSPKAEIPKGRHLQLPLYMLAVQQLLLPTAEPVAALLQCTQRKARRIGLAKADYNDIHYQFGTREKSLCTAEEWDELCAQAVAHVRQLVAMIRRAEFPAEWHDCAQWCEWRGVCGDF